jgi:hypothetical protein
VTLVKQEDCPFTTRAAHKQQLARQLKRRANEWHACQKGMAPIKRCQMLMVGCQHLVQHSIKRSTARRRCSKMTLSTPVVAKGDCEGMRDHKLGMFLSGLSFEESQAEEDVISSISTSLKQSVRLHRLHHESRQNEMFSSAICNANLDLRWWGCLIVLPLMQEVCGGRRRAI